jgi:hypothetical protein
LPLPKEVVEKLSGNGQEEKQKSEQTPRARRGK